MNRLIIMSKIYEGDYRGQTLGVPGHSQIARWSGLCRVRDVAEREGLGSGKKGELKCGY